MQKFRFHYQFEGKGLTKQFWSECQAVRYKKNQNGRQNLIWLPISSFLSQYP